MFAFIFSTKGQAFEPTVLILTPYNTSADASLQDEINEYNEMISQSRGRYMRSLEMVFLHEEDLAENEKIMYRKQMEFFDHLDYFGMVTSISEAFLQFLFSEHFEDLLIYATNEKVESDAHKFEALADKNETQFVINFSEVSSFIIDGSKQTRIRLQLYDNNKNEILLDKEYIGHDHDPGLKFACDEGSLSCTINNALSAALNEVASLIVVNI